MTFYDDIFEQTRLGKYLLQVRRVFRLAASPTTYINIPIIETVSIIENFAGKRGFLDKSYLQFFC